MLSGWASHPMVPPQRPTPQHQRSLSTVPRSSASSSHRVSRAISTSSLNGMATANAAQTNPSQPSSLRTSNYYNDDDEHMSTIPDPRSRTMSPANGAPPSPSQHPDLNDEVAALSTKLINAINHQTNLDDTLSATRHELESAREQIRVLEGEREDHRKQVADGVIVLSSVVQVEKSRIRGDLSEEKRLRVEENKKHRETIAEERRLRGEVETEKTRIEGELENLTAELFEEANKMVAQARKEASADHDIIQKKNDQLKSQMAEMEALLKTHQEQLASLKQVMEQMRVEQDDHSAPTAPSTPGMSKYDSKDDIQESTEATHSTALPDFQPSYPTSFTHLIQPVLRTDLSAYDDFSVLLKLSKAQAASRVSSGSYGGIGLGLGLGGSAMSSVLHQHQPSNGSTSSLNTPITAGSSPGTPTTPASSIGASSPTTVVPPLRETKFYKRAYAEDIEPTLRLDIAPGLSWLSRKSVLNAMCDGSLVVEPMPPTSVAKLYVFPCSLCGENRKEAEHIRAHRFRTSESESAQRYPLCQYCLGRVRSTCDFLNFLRMLKDGHWRTEDEESEKAAWEESVRLREQMFWCRMGGGVVPTPHSHRQRTQSEEPKTPRLSEEQRKELEELKKLSEEFERTGELKPRDITPVEVKQLDNQTSHELIVARRRALVTKSVDSEAEVLGANPIDSPAKGNIDEKKGAANRESTLSTSSLSVASEGKQEEKRLSITIPRTSEGQPTAV